MGDNNADYAGGGSSGFMPAPSTKKTTGPLQIGGVTATPTSTLKAPPKPTTPSMPPWMPGLLGNRMGAIPPAVPPPPTMPSFLRPPVALASSPSARSTSLPSNLSSLLGSAGFHSGPTAPPGSDSDWIKQLFPGA